MVAGLACLAPTLGIPSPAGFLVSRLAVPLTLVAFASYRLALAPLPSSIVYHVDDIMQMFYLSIFSVPLISLVTGFTCFGFSGSRSPAPASLAALSWLCGQLPLGASVVVGCARGIDQAARLAFPGAQVFYASSFGSGRSSFAARSVACVQAVAASSGLWVAFPSTPCPVGLLPSARSSQAFSGKGSGTWASLAFAVGSGVSCLVFLPSGMVAPPAWGLLPLGDGWFHFSPATVQGSLF